MHDCSKASKLCLLSNNIKFLLIETRGPLFCAYRHDPPWLIEDLVPAKFAALRESPPESSSQGIGIISCNIEYLLTPAASGVIGP